MKVLLTMVIQQEILGNRFSALKKVVQIFGVFRTGWTIKNQGRKHISHMLSYPKYNPKGRLEHE